MLVDVAGAAHAVAVVVEAVPADVVVAAAGVVVAGAAHAADVAADLPGRQAVCMTGKCGSTTVDIVLHNSIDYYKLDIGSFLFLHPSKRVNSENNTGIKT